MPPVAMQLSPNGKSDVPEDLAIAQLETRIRAGERKVLDTESKGTSAMVFTPSLNNFMDVKEVHIIATGSEYES